MRHALLAIAVIMLMALSSCSGSDDAVAPGPVDVGQSANSSHACWGLWQMTIDPAAGTMEVVPMREGQGHLNVLVFLEPPPFLNLTLESLKFEGDEVFADVGLKHPFVGLKEFTGFDVSGILITNGSYTGYGDTDIRHAAEGDTYLMNADGYSRWWNPSEFPYNPSAPIDGYINGLLGTPDSVAHYNSTINGYKYFTDGLNPDDSIEDVDFTSRGYFTAGKKNIRQYHIKLGSDGLVLNYAIDACWAPPLSNPPAIPDGFPPAANRTEPWRVTVAEIENTLWWNGVTGGGDLTLQIHVWDWFGIDDITVLVEAPTAGQSVEVETPITLDELNGHAVFEAELPDCIITSQSAIRCLITAMTSESGYGNYIFSKRLSSFVPVISGIPVYTSPPVALAEATSPTGIATGGTVDFDGTESYDPDGTIDEYLWDFDEDGIYGDTHAGPPETPTATFNESGTFMVDLKVIDNTGLEDTLDEKIEVYVSPFAGECTIPGDKYDYRDDAALPYNYALEPVMLSEGYLVILAGGSFYNELALYKTAYEHEWLWTPTQSCNTYNPDEDNFCPWYKEWYAMPSANSYITHMDSWLNGTGDVIEDDIFCYVIYDAPSQIVVMGDITDDGTPPSQIDSISVGFPVVCFDFASNGDLWVLDNNDTMHRYVKDSSFTEAPGDSFSLPSGVYGNVFDFAICYFNSNFYVFTDDTEGGTIYRLSPSGALLDYEPDALRMTTLNTGPIGDRGDIEIDHAILPGEVAGQEVCRIMVGGGGNASVDFAVFARYNDTLDLITTWQDTNQGISRPEGVGAIFFDSTNHYMWTMADPTSDPLKTIWCNSWWPIPDDW